MMPLPARRATRLPRYPEEGVLRPTSARALAGAGFLVAAAAGASLLYQLPPLTALLIAGIPAFGAALVWAVYWRPRVDISPAGMEFVNILRTTVIPWPAVEGFDLRYGLAVRTRWRTQESAWALPRAMKRTVPHNRHRPVERSSEQVDGGSARVSAGSEPADGSGSPNPLIAAVVDYHAELEAQGFLTDPVLETSAPPRRWNISVITVLLVTGLWAAAAVLLLQTR